MSPISELCNLLEVRHLNKIYDDFYDDDDDDDDDDDEMMMMMINARSVELFRN